MNSPPYSLNRGALIWLILLAPSLAMGETGQDRNSNLHNNKSLVKAKRADTDSPEIMPEMTVTYSPDTDRSFPLTTKATPAYTIDKIDIDTKVNATTTEDVLRYSPSLHMRKRYIGDQNAMIGIRGANILQTTHNMVFGDGMPLHNPVNTSFAGVPRWSMMAPSEIQTAEVLYGPYSAQYGGGSMGGVINLNSRMPDKFEAEMNVTGLFQDMHRGGRNELLSGFRTFLSGGDRINKFSVFGFYNHLENDGQPMDPIDVQPLTTAANGTRVTGGQLTQQPTGAPAIIFGDNGTQHVVTDLFKLKMAYDLTEELQARFTIAYEERDNRNNEPLSLLKNLAGNTVYSGTVNQNGQRFTVPNNAFGANILERQSLNYGLSLKGKISDNWSIDTTASYFDPFRNTAIASTYSPKDNIAANTGQGQITDTDTWWATYDGKLATDKFLGREDLSFMGGYQLVHGSNNTKVFDTQKYVVANKDFTRSDAGGQTETNSVFSQLNWRFLPDWSIIAGARLDHWQALGGHNRVFVNDPATPADDTKIPSEFTDRDASRISPKAALEFTPDRWTFRYSFSKAYRFPVAEELFSATNTFLARNTPDPTLGPESGYFHNFLTQYDIPRGYIQANFFYDTIKNEIVSISQSFGGQNISTFQAIGQTETIGAELTFRQNDLFGLPIDLLANGTFMNKQITKNPNNQALVGNEWARIPKLQANASATYRILPVWDASVGVRYRSDIFQRYENNDTVANVFNGSDEYTFVDFKTTYQLPLHPKLKSAISAGVDNILDQDRYENNPLPQRSYYVSISLKY
ncbi:MAG: TonB-dependent receptor [Methylobacter sp.]|nr:TonB-dependent receptor [Methylobacter sp.]